MCYFFIKSGLVMSNHKDKGKPKNRIHGKNQR